jgi:uncharacterized protein (TIGR02284 family)
MDDTLTIEVLNKLIQINNDRFEGYETVFKETEEQYLKTLFNLCMLISQQCKQPLINEVMRYRGQPTDSTKIAGKFFRVWMDVKAAITSKDKKVIFSSSLYGEIAAIERYQHILDNDLENVSFEQQKIINAQAQVLFAAEKINQHQNWSNVYNKVVNRHAWATCKLRAVLQEIKLDKLSRRMKISSLLFEFEDLYWFPNSIRESMMDCLCFIIKMLNIYQPVIPLIMDGLQKTDSKQIVDLCSGGGGAMEQISENINQQSDDKIKIVLTDKFPNLNAFQLLATKSKSDISFLETSIDAANVPSTLIGFRTIFSAFHHFSKPYAKSVIQNAVDAKSGIGIFDGGDKNIFIIIGLILIHPFIFFFCTPFFRPFRFSRLFFTYLIPIIPICQIWDGIVSIIRLYKPDELLKIATEVDTETYCWRAGKMKNKFGMHVNYLIGYPK